jgi:hypothetical protein
MRRVGQQLFGFIGRDPGLAPAAMGLANRAILTTLLPANDRRVSPYVSIFKYRDEQCTELPVKSP